MADPLTSFRRPLTPLWVGTLCVFAWLCYAVPQVRAHGLTSDSPALFYAGDRTLYWFTHSGDPAALDFNQPDPRGFHSTFDRFPDPDSPLHYPILPALAGSLTAKLFCNGLHWLDDVAAHHLGLVLFHGLALFIYGCYATALLGPWAGGIASLALLLFPSLVGHAFNNPKDLACADFYGCAMLATGLGFVRGQLRHFFAGALLLGLCLGCKFNGVFAVATLFVWTQVALFALHRGAPWLRFRLSVAMLWFPLVAFLVFFLSWPWLYVGKPVDWIHHLLNYVLYMADFGLGSRTAWTNYPLRILAFTTPPLVLVLSLLGVAFGFREVATRSPREPRLVWLLCVLWTLVPLLRVAMPRSSFFDMNRHFLEYIPGLCALAGLGFAQVLAYARESLPPRLAVFGTHPVWASAVLTTLAVVLAWPLWEYRPFETAYFNVLAGGLGGAQQDALLRMPANHIYLANETEGDYWEASLADFKQWVLRERPARVAVCGLGYQNFMIQFEGEQKPRFRESNFDLADVVYVAPRGGRCEWSQIRKLEAEHSLVGRVERGGGLIYEILGPKLAWHGEPLSRRSRYED